VGKTALVVIAVQGAPLHRFLILVLVMSTPFSTTSKVSVDKVNT
jgi:hypothetical protein